MLEVDQKLKRELIKPKLDVNYNFLSYNTGSLNPDFRSNNYNGELVYHFHSCCVPHATSIKWPA